jgi:hypothetical protein
VSESWRTVNYDLRPAKNIERKMLLEAFRCLRVFGSMNSYQYVGFGSVFFSDFKLFHRSLGITQMISIEYTKRRNEQRFNFNRPYSCVKMEFGKSNDVLPNLNWAQKTILWLDYDKKSGLDEGHLEDVAYFCANAVPGSVLVVTEDAREGDPPEEILDSLVKHLAEKVPVDVKYKDLVGWGTARVYRRIIDDEIQTTLYQRNAALGHEEQVQYTQLFNFEYEDSTKMVTSGGLLYERRQEARVQECDFESLRFVRSGKKPYQIVVPNLTINEIRHLDRNLPHRDGCPISLIDAKRYSELYRYFPAFVEAEL